MVPLVAVMVPVLFCRVKGLSRPASGEMSRSAKVSAGVGVRQVHAVAGGTVNCRIAEVGRDRRTRHQEPDAGVDSVRLVVLEVNVPLPPLMTMPLAPPSEEDAGEGQAERGVGQRRCPASRSGLQ